MRLPSVPVFRPLAVAALAVGWLVLGCSDDDNSSTFEPGLREDVVLGYEVEEVWHYHDLDDPSLALGGDSLQAWLSVTVGEEGYLYNQRVRLVRERTDWHEWGRPLETVGTDQADLYYQERSGGLLLMAWTGGSNLALGLGSDPFARLADRRPGKPAASTDDDLVIEDPPLVVFEYPLEAGDQWTYRQAGYPYRIDKQVLEVGPQDPDGFGERTCATLEWLYDIDRDGVWDSDLAMTTISDELGVATSSLEMELTTTHPVSGLRVGAHYRLSLVRASDSTRED